MKAKCVALIPARKGSKGIPGKNTRPLMGVPLIEYSLKNAIDSSLIERVFVSTDDQDIVDMIGAREVIPILRPNYLATDEARMEDVVLHFLKEVELEEDTIVVLLQPTSPLRTSDQIDEAILLFRENKCNSLISTQDVENTVLKCLVVNPRTKRLDPINSPEFTSAPRQTLPKVVKPNGAIFIFKNNIFKKERSFYAQPLVNYSMNAETSKDLDTIEDLYEVEEILKGKD